MKNALIYNPFAAKGASEFCAERVLVALKSVGLESELMKPGGSIHVDQLVEQAAMEGAERIFVSGGDGSLNEAVNGLVRAQKQGYTRAALGLIPNGRGNDFAAAIQMPKTLPEIVRVFANDHRQRVDIGVAGDGTFERYFINGSGFGIDSAVNYYASRSPLKGKLTYVHGVVQSIFHDMKQQTAKLTIDGVESEYPIVLFTAMNGCREGGGFRIAPDFDLSDGLLEICMVGGGHSAPKLLTTLPDLANGTKNSPLVKRFRAASVHVHFEADQQGLFSQVDGETIIVRGHDFYAAISPYKADLICNPKNP